MSYIGKIAVDTSIENSIATQKAKVGKNIVNVDFSGPIENIAIFEKVYVFAVFCFEEGEKKAFKILETAEAGSGILLWVDYKEADGVYLLTTESFKNEEDKNFSLENFFHGVAEVEIKESFELLHKSYSIAKKKEILIGIGIVSIIIAIILLFLLFRDKPEPVKTNQHLDINTTVVLLTPTQIFRLKNLLSIDLISKINSEAIAIIENPILNNKASIRSLSLIYDLPEGKVVGKGLFGFEYMFPVRDSALSSGSLFAKSTPFVIEKNALDLKTAAHTFLTEECVRAALFVIKPEFVQVTERTNNQIKVQYKEMRPDEVVGVFKNTLSRCPIAIDSIAIAADGKFEITAILFDEENL